MLVSGYVSLNFFFFGNISSKCIYFFTYITGIVYPTATKRRDVQPTQIYCLTILFPLHKNKNKMNWISPPTNMDHDIFFLSFLYAHIFHQFTLEMTLRPYSSHSFLFTCIFLYICVSQMVILINQHNRPYSGICTKIYMCISLCLDVRRIKYC